MYALIADGKISKYPYGPDALRRDNPDTSFPVTIPDERLAEMGVFPVAPTAIPSYDPITQNVSEASPELRDGVWTQVWIVTQASQEEIDARTAARLEELKMMRAAAYREEADPIFFKAQRGEATMEEWEAKVLEIQNRYPYPTV